MKLYAAAVFVLLTGLPAGAWAQEGSLSVSFGTSSAGGRFSPNHILAVWVETASGDFVRTLTVSSDSRYSRYLRAWNGSASGNGVDAVTTATLRAYDERTVTWDLKDAGGRAASPGSYVLRLELCDANASSEADNNQGAIAFDLGTDDFASSGSDGGFSNVTLSFVAPITLPPDPTTPDAAIELADASLSPADAALDSGADVDAGTSIDTPAADEPLADTVVAMGDAGPLRAQDHLYSDPMCRAQSSVGESQASGVVMLLGCVLTLAWRRRAR